MLSSDDMMGRSGNLPLRACSVVKALGEMIEQEVSSGAFYKRGCPGYVYLFGAKSV